MCRTGCKTQDHESWGACARAARTAVWGPNHETYVAGDRETEQYREARKDGLEPEGIYPQHVEKAKRERDMKAAFDDAIAKG